MATQSQTRPPVPVRGRRVWQWGDVRRRNLGMWAYVLNRLSGLGLVLYLYIHLMVLSTLARGPEAWDPFIAIVRAPAFLMLDVVVLAGLLIHGLNGLRVTLTGFGVGVRVQKTMFLALMAIGALAGAYGVWLIFTQ
jgi:succinate dehydrogenase / fumarate reductase cytochrome b subunit